MTNDVISKDTLYTFSNVFAISIRNMSFKKYDFSLFFISFLGVFSEVLLNFYVNYKVNKQVKFHFLAFGRVLVEVCIDLILALTPSCKKR